MTNELHRRLKELHPETCVDGGAYKGHFVDFCLETWPQAVVHAFEPIPKRARKLWRRMWNRDNVRVYGMALSDEQSHATLHITKRQTMTSLLPPAEIIGGENAVAETVAVPKTRLDAILSSPPDLLKLDVQGAELAALTGCGELLPHIGAVLVEVAPLKRYAGQPDPEAVPTLLESHGFKPVASELHDDNVPDELQVSDVLFVHASRL